MSSREVLVAPYKMEVGDGLEPSIKELQSNALPNLAILPYEEAFSR